MKALVIGLGISGKSATTFLEKRGVKVVGYDDKLAPVEIEEIRDFSLVVLSPGVPLSHPLCLRAKAANVPIKGEAELALETISQRCIGVTGTNGKTTVVKMLEHCLQACGKKARAVGNVGVPLTSCVDEEGILVVELSSFQLETLTTKAFEVGVILNIAEDHLNRYHSMEEYAKAKVRLEGCIKEGGQLFVHQEVDSALFSLPYHRYGGGNLEAVRLVCAHFGVGEREFLQAASSFSKPSHRLEFIAEVQEVKYYNDSKATNVAAVLYALETLQTKVILLLGGQDKGLSFHPLRAYCDQLKCVIPFGQAREKIANALQNCHIAVTMEEAVEMAFSFAKPGDTILFSPGCASLDAFKNYEERGEEFKRLVRRRLA